MSLNTTPPMGSSAGHLASALAEATQAIGHLHTLAAMLACVDPVRWASLGRPPADGLAALLFMVHAQASGALDEITEAQGSG